MLSAEVSKFGGGPLRSCKIEKGEKKGGRHATEGDVGAGRDVLSKQGMQQLWPNWTREYRPLWKKSTRTTALLMQGVQKGL